MNERTNLELELKELCQDLIALNVLSMVYFQQFNQILQENGVLSFVINVCAHMVFFNLQTLVNFYFIYGNILCLKSLG
jgi:hypothetical protein